MLIKRISKLKSSILRKSFKLIIVLLIIIFSIQLVILFSLKNEINESNSQNHIQLVKEKNNALDQSLFSVLNFISATSQDSYLLNFHFSSYTQESEMYLEAWNIGEYLFDLALIDNIVESYIVYLKDKNVIIAPDYATLKIKDYYDFAPVAENVRYEDWVDPDFKEGLLQISYINEAEDAFGSTMIIKTPFIRFSENNNMGFIETYIDLNEFALISQFSSDYSAMMIIDETDNIVYNSGSDDVREEYLNYLNKENDSFKGRSFYTYSSTVLPLEYVYVFESDPSILIINRLFVAITVIIIILFVLLIIALVLGSGMTKKYMHEVAVMLESSDDQNFQNQYSAIKTSIANLTQNYSDLHSEYIAQVNLLRSNLITQLVHSSLNTEDEILCYVKNLQFEYLISNYYVFICGKIPYEATITSAKELIKPSKDLFFDYGYVSYLQPLVNNRFCILVGRKKEFNGRDVSIAITELTEEIRKKFDFIPFFVIGKGFADLSYLQVSYYKELSVLDETKFQSKTNVIFSSFASTNRNIHCIPTEIEANIITSVQLGNYDQVEKLINNVVTENDITNYDYTKFIHELRSLLIKLVYSNIKNDDERDEYLRDMTSIFGTNMFEYIFSDVKKMLKKICLIAVENKLTRQESTAQKIQDYIIENYTNSNLCRTQIADHFNISEKHVSRIFKESFDQSTAAYIENLRMKKAIEYVIHDNCNISEIGSTVGFINQNTFYKAFKRKYGVSPSEYRTQINKNNGIV